MKFNKILYVLVLISLIVTFNSCQKDDSIIQQTPLEEDFSIKTIEFNKLSIDDQEFVLNFNSQFNKELQSKSNAEAENILIDSTSAYEVIKDDLTTLTFSVIGDFANNELKNVVISEKGDGSQEYYLVEYDFSNELSTIEEYELHEHVTNSTISSIDPSTLVLGKSSVYSSVAKTSGSCWSVTTTTVNYCDDANGNTQIDNGQLGNGCMSNWRTQTITTINIDLDCLDSDYGNTGGGGTNTSGNDNSSGQDSGQNSAGNGTSDGGGDGGSTIITAPKKSSGEYVATEVLINFLDLGNLSSSDLNWINDPINGFQVNSLNQFINDYNLGTNSVDSIIDMIGEMSSNNVNIYEVLLTLGTKFFVVDWVPNIGAYNGIPSLSYTHTRIITINGYNHFQFLLSNGDILSSSTYPMTSFGTEPVSKLFYFSQQSEFWYEIPEPSSYSPLSLDFLWDGFWNAAQLGARYCTPLEDIVILIDGRDFDGVEQSRAVAAAFILVDLVPGTAVVKGLKLIKYGDEVVQLAEAAIKIADDIYLSQRQTVQWVLDGVIFVDLDEFGNTVRKGNFGEMVTDVDLYSKGYEPLHLRRTNIDEPLSQGIDGVFKNPVTGEYIIVESKYHTSSLSQLSDGTRQMSDDWILGGNRLVNEVGQELADDIIDEGYTRVLARIYPDGTIAYHELDASAQVIDYFWTP